MTTSGFIQRAERQSIGKTTVHVSKIYTSVDWPKKYDDCVTKEKSNSSDHRTISLISYTGKVVARILSKRLESKIEEVIEDHFEFRKVKALGDAIGLMRIISEWVLDIRRDVSVS